VPEQVFAAKPQLRPALRIRISKIDRGLPALVLELASAVVNPKAVRSGYGIPKGEEQRRNRKEKRRTRAAASDLLH